MFTKVFLAFFAPQVKDREIYPTSQGLDHHGAAIHSGKALRETHESDLGSDHGLQ